MPVITTGDAIRWTPPTEDFPFTICELPDTGSGRRYGIKIAFGSTTTSTTFGELVSEARVVIKDVENWLKEAKIKLKCQD